MGEVWQIVLVCLGCVLVLVGVFFIIRHFIHSSKVKKGEENVQKALVSTTDSLADKFGGKDNILSITQSGSRVSVIVSDIKLIDKDGITKAIDNVMFMGTKIVFVIGSDSSKFKELLESKAANKDNNNQ
ncbi:MAG: hypothetical protein WCR67_05575 [Bacilli bacterium]